MRGKHTPDLGKVEITHLMQRKLRSRVEVVGIEDVCVGEGQVRVPGKEAMENQAGVRLRGALNVRPRGAPQGDSDLFVGHPKLLPSTGSLHLQMSGVYQATQPSPGTSFGSGRRTSSEMRMSWALQGSLYSTWHSAGPCG